MNIENLYNKMAKAIATVKRLWKTRPLLVNCITYGTLYGGAELSQQCLIRKAFVSMVQLSDSFATIVK